MAVSADKWLSVVHRALDEERKRNQVLWIKLGKEGVSDDDRLRRVYFPWKTPDEFQEMKREYDATFGRNDAA